MTRSVSVLALVCIVMMMVVAPQAWAQEEAASGDSESLGSFSLAPKFGYAWFGASTGYSTTGILDHHAFNLQLNLDFGGQSAFELAPYYTYHAVGSDIHTVGVLLGYAYRWSTLGGKLYPSIGFGVKLGYMVSDGIDYGLEIIGRIPVGITYYVLEDLGIVAEFGIGSATLAYTGYGNDFGASIGLYIDFLVGIRWP